MKRCVAVLCLVLTVAGASGCGEQPESDRGAPDERPTPAEKLELAEPPKLCPELDLDAIGTALGGTVTRGSGPDYTEPIFDACRLSVDKNGERGDLVVGVSAQPWKRADLDANSKSYNYSQGGVFEVENVDGVGDGAFATEQELVFLAHDRAAFVFDGLDEGGEALPRERFVELAELVMPELKDFPVQRDGGIVPICERATDGIADVVGSEPPARRDSVSDDGKGATCTWVGTAKYITASIDQPANPKADLKDVIADQGGKPQRIDVGDEGYLTDWSVAFRTGSYVVTVTPDGFPRKLYVRFADAIADSLGQ